MNRRVLPYHKLGGRTVRFDPEQCDIALQNYEYRSIFDDNIRAELARRQAVKVQDELQNRGE
jgi:hypothetical protein